MLAIIILVFGNFLSVSSDALFGEIYGHVLGSVMVPAYDSRHIFKNGYGKIGSSIDRSIEGVKSVLDRLRAKLQKLKKHVNYLGMPRLSHQALYNFFKSP